MTSGSYTRLVRSTGYYDALLMLPFLFPGAVAWTHSILEAIDAELRLPGAVGEFPSLAFLFVNVMAAIGTVWAIARIRDPRPEYGFWDGVSRLVIGLLVVVYVVFLEATTLLLPFAAVEAGLGLVQVRGYAMWRHLPAGRGGTTHVRSDPADPREGRTTIVWEPPAPRSGWKGAADRVFGPGATAAEYALQAIAVVGLTGAALALSAQAPEAPSRSTSQWVVLTILAVDVVGGVVTNATSAAKRWYHRPGRGLSRHLGFVAMHGVHLALFTVVLHGMEWPAMVLCYGLLLAAAAVLLTVPAYLQRPLAMALLAGLLLVSLAIVPTGTGLAWFLPIFFLKLIVAYLVPEAPFRPVGSKAVSGRRRPEAGPPFRFSRGAGDGRCAE